MMEIKLMKEPVINDEDQVCYQAEAKSLDGKRSYCVIWDIDADFREQISAGYSKIDSEDKDGKPNGKFMLFDKKGYLIDQGYACDWNKYRVYSGNEFLGDESDIKLVYPKN